MNLIITILTNQKISISQTVLCLINSFIATQNIVIRMEM